MNQPVESSQQIHIDNMYGDINGPSSGRPKDASQNVKLPEVDKQWLVDTAAAVAMHTGNNKYGASTVAREAVAFYKRYYRHSHKLRKYEKAVHAFLDNLP